jgi:hypothetical protein
MGVAPKKVYLTEYFDPTQNGGDDGNVYSNSCPNEKLDKRELTALVGGLLGTSIAFLTGVPLLPELLAGLGATFGAATVVPAAKVRQYGHEHLVKPLNEAVREAAMKHKWHLIGGAPSRNDFGGQGIEAVFEGHGVCSPKELSWITSALQSYERQGDNRGSWHANGAGQSVMRSIILGVLEPALKD